MRHRQSFVDVSHLLEWTPPALKAVTHLLSSLRKSVDGDNTRSLQNRASPRYSRCILIDLDRDIEPKRRTDSDLTTDSDFSIHEFDKLLANRQSQTGAAKSTRCRAVDL